ncbi:MAG: HAD-IIA family hydrolase [Christensenellaceae bacterium]|nr:HAD-IIA family hydrolase [Christensenellaceae bacterium]
MPTPLKDIECFVFDMDGTINLGDSLIPGALELIEELRQSGTQFFFFTNNSSRSPLAYVEKLTRLGFSGMDLSHIVTSGDVTIHYLQTHFENPAIYLAGTPSLEEQFKKAGITLLEPDTPAADAVVIGFDTTFDFKKADAACRLIAAGTPFLATNIDRVCPLEGGAFLPDCGSMCAMLTHATGVKAKFLGKPAKETVDYILARAGTPPEKTAMVGDRLYTDIATAVNGGIVGIAVLSGEISQKDIDESPICPDYTLDSVADILSAIRRTR